MSQAPPHANPFQSESSGALGSQAFSNFLVPGVTTAPPASTVAESSPTVKAYQTLLEGPLADYLKLSSELGGLTHEQVSPQTLPSLPPPGQLLCRTAPLTGESVIRRSEPHGAPPLTSVMLTSQAGKVSEAFTAQLSYLEFTAACTKLPSTSPAFADKLGPTATALSAAVELKDKNRGSKEINLLNTVAEGIPAIGWVQVVSPLAS